MSTASGNIAVSEPARPAEHASGEWAMRLFVATEAMLFALLFFSYFYLGTRAQEWPPHVDPNLVLALAMAGLLVTSSVVLHWAERGIRRDDQARLRLGLIATIVLGLSFLSIQALEFREHLQEVTPQSGAYGSVFYTITSFHAAHVLTGLLMLGYVLVIAFRGYFSAARHAWVRNTSLYWHFVDVVWLFIIVILYLSPRLTV